jgi:hypothetical protein
VLASGVPVSVDDGRDGEERTRAAEAELRIRRFERSVCEKCEVRGVECGYETRNNGSIT